MPIQTRADFELIQNEIRAELAKPEPEQDIDFLQSAVAQLKEAEPRIGPRVEGAASAAVQEGALAGTEVPVQPKRIQSTQQGFPTDISPQQQLGTRALMEGAQQRFRELGNFFKRLGMTDEEAAAAAQQEAQRDATAQVRLAEAARVSGVDPASLDLPRTAGTLVPDVATAVVPGALPVRTGMGALARITAETAAGGVLGGASVPLDKDLTFQNTGLPALGSGVLGSLAEIPQLGRNLIFAESRAALNSDAARVGKQVEDLTGIDLTVSELSSNPAAAQAEAAIGRVAGGPKDLFLKRRQQQIQASFDELDRTLNPQRLTTGTIIRQTKDAVEARVLELRNIAGTQFRADLQPGLRAVGARLDDQGRILGGRRVVPVTNVIEEMARQAELAREPLSGVSPGALRSIEREIAELQALDERGGLTFGELQRRVSEFTNPTRGAVKDATRAKENLDDRLILQAIFRDMQAAEDGLAVRIREINPATSSGTGVGPVRPQDGPQTIEGSGFERLNDPKQQRAVVAALRAAREGYARNFGAVKQLENTATERLLAKVGDPSAEEFAQKLVSLPKQEFADLMRTLDEYNAGASRALRGRIFYELVDKHTVADAGLSTLERAAPTIQLPELLAEFQKMPFEKFQAFIGDGLTAPQSQRLRAGLLAFQKIAEGPQNQGSTRSILRKIEDFAINAASRDVGFLSRLGAGQFGPGLVERVLFTKKGRNALEALGDPKIAAPLFAQSMNFLINAMRDEDEQTARIKAQLQQQNEQQAEQLGARMTQGF